MKRWIATLAGVVCALGGAAGVGWATGEVSYALISDYYGQVAYVSLDGANPSAPPIDVTNPSQFPWGSFGIGIGDFDNDGLEDYVIGGYTGTGYAAIQFHKRLDGAGNYAPGVSVDGASSTYYDVMDFGVADFDHDGNLDFAINAGDNHQVIVYRGHGDGTFERTLTFTVSYANWGMDTADLNGDGNADIVVAPEWDPSRYYTCYYDYYYYYYYNYDPTENCSMNEVKLSVFLGDGHGGFTQSDQRYFFSFAGQESSHPWSNYIFGLSAGDFDGDGKVDVAVTDYYATTDGNPFFVFRGNGDGTFHSDPIRTGGSIYNNYQYGGLDNTDANGDGIQDLVLGSPNDATVRTYYGNGDGTFTLGPVSHMTQPNYYYFYGLSTSPDAGAADRTPPQVALAALPPLTNNPQAVLSGTATDAGGIATLEVLRDGQVITTASPTGGTFTVAVPLVEGAQTFSIRATDRAGNSATSTSVSITLDTQPPQLAVDPTPQYATDSTFALSGVASDANGLASVTALVNGVHVPAAIDFAGHVTATLTLVPGTNTVGFEATDNAGNTSHAQAQVILDTAGPSVAVADLPAFTNQGAQTIHGTATDTYGVASLVLVVNGASVGAPFTPAADGSFAVSAVLAEGANSVVVQAVNVAGLTGAAQTQSFLDTIAPSAQLAALPDYTNQVSLPVSGSVADVGSGIASVQLRVVGGASSGPLAPSAEGHVAAALSLSEGAQTIILDVTDRAGNTSSVSADTILDTIAPSVAIVSPGNGQPFGATSIPLTASVTDASPTTVTFGTLQFHLTAGGGTASGSVDLPGEGPATLHVVARDAAGNEAAADVGVVVDLTAPVADLDLAGLSDGAQIGPQPGNAVLYTLHVDDLTKVTTTESWDGSFSYGFPAGGGVLQGSAPLTEGLDSFALQLTDEVGHVTTVTRTLTYDVTPPTAALAGILATPGSPVRGSVELSATATDNLTGIKGANLTVDGVAVGTVANGATFTGVVDTTTLADGSHAVAITFVDGVGNTTTLTSSILVDNTAPVATVTSPSAGAYVHQTIQIGASAQDATSGVAELDLEVAGVVIKRCATTTCSASFDTTTLANGSFAIAAIARDAAGNVARSATVTAISDNTAPSKFLVSPLNGAVAGASTTLSVKVVDDNFDRVECFDDGVSLGVSTAPQFSRTVSLLDKLDGPVVFTCSARDLAGNVGTESATIRVQNWAIQVQPRTVNIKASGQWVQLEIDGPNVANLMPLTDKNLALAVPGGAPVPLAAKPGGYQVTTSTVNGVTVQSLNLKFDRDQFNAALKGGLASHAITDTSNVTVRFLAGSRELDRDSIKVQQ